MQLEDLVRESEVMVIADLSEIKNWDETINDYEVIQHASGILSVRRAIWGKYKSGDRITLYWSNNSSISCPRNEHHDTKGKNYIWMLRYDDDGKLITGTNQRVRQLDEESQIDSLLKEHPFFMKGLSGYYPENSSVEIFFTYRNVFEHDVTIPLIAFKNGSIHLHPTYKLELAWNQLPQDKIISTQDSVLVPARTEYTVTIPIRDISGFEKRGYYRFRILTEERPEVQQRK
ncbi:MAG: hypothetical protein V4642_07625, partial [Bacteroidota bacterium]